MANDWILNLDQAKDLLGLPQTSTINDPRLQLLLSAVTARIEEYLGRALFSDTHTKKFVGGNSKLFLRNYPIGSITSIADPASNTIAATEYILFEELGILQHRSIWPRALDTDGYLARWTITYVAGLYADAAALPVRYNGAASYLISDMWNRPESQVRSVGQGRDIGTDYFKNAEIMPPEVAALIGGDVTMF